MFIRFNLIYERERRTDVQTDTARQQILRLHRAVKMNKKLSYRNRSHISYARRTQYVEAINSNCVTLKSRLGSLKIIANGTIR